MEKNRHAQKENIYYTSPWPHLVCVVVVQSYVGGGCCGGGDDGRSPAMDSLSMGWCWEIEELCETSSANEEKAAGVDFVDGEWEDACGATLM
ncbi:hypothetical protein C2S51_011587 [Perilla frutescens var. frutescens]|nr:hypothetical protein C2S51_011587 [Perilla frutescens var. frutescens]